MQRHSTLRVSLVRTMNVYVKVGVLTGVAAGSGSLMATVLTWILLGGYYTLYLAYHTLPRDIM